MTCSSMNDDMSISWEQWPLGVISPSFPATHPARLDARVYLFWVGYTWLLCRRLMRLYQLHQVTSPYPHTPGRNPACRQLLGRNPCTHRAWANAGEFCCLSVTQQTILSDVCQQCVCSIVEHAFRLHRSELPSKS